ncbi:MAG: uncharacterized protein KVP18_000714 [Porospora cf. gigantea A]|uniref:uncharacterized protein n=1 Tax=Porospora cf. gigantea A TaxID=2853593 RepID=UPI003559C70B|nr:MAG: hypothetical protein KVP18_000714 [Porospora cf. gigantea A]
MTDLEIQQWISEALASFDGSEAGWSEALTVVSQHLTEVLRGRQIRPILELRVKQQVSDLQLKRCQKEKLQRQAANLQAELQSCPDLAHLPVTAVPVDEDELLAARNKLSGLQEEVRELKRSLSAELQEWACKVRLLEAEKRDLERRHAKEADDLAESLDRLVQVELRLQSDERELKIHQEKAQCLQEKLDLHRELIRATEEEDMVLGMNFV